MSPGKALYFCFKEKNQFLTVTHILIPVNFKFYLRNENNNLSIFSPSFISFWKILIPFFER